MVHAGSAHVRRRASHLRRLVGSPPRGAGAGGCVPPWTIVNDVAGFIGPEVFRNADQLERACLEDSMMAKLHGLTMGLDVCATFHMGIAPRELRLVTERSSIEPRRHISWQWPATPTRCSGISRPRSGEHPALAPSRWTADDLGDGAAIDRAWRARAGWRTTAGVETVARLYATYARNAGDRRTRPARGGGIAATWRAARPRPRPRRWTTPDADARLDRIYAHARRALYASLDEGVVSDASPRTCACARPLRAAG